MKKQTRFTHSKIVNHNQTAAKVDNLISVYPLLRSQIWYAKRKIQNYANVSEKSGVYLTWLKTKT